MNLKLPASVLKTLPEPDRKGVVRVVVGLRMGEDGDASVAEINDVPVAGDDEAEEPEEDGMEESPETEAPPSADEIDAALKGPM